MSTGLTEPPIGIPDTGQGLGQPEPPIVTGPRVVIPSVTTPEPPLVEPPPTVSPPSRQGGLPDWVVIAIILVAFGLAYLAEALTNFLNAVRVWFLSPFLRGGTGTPLDPGKVTQALTGPLGGAIASADPTLGGNFSQLASEVANVGHEIAANAATDAALATAIVGQSHGLKAAGAQTAHETATRRAQVHTLQREQHAASVQLHGLSTHVTHVLEPELNNLRKQIPALHKGQATLWDEIKKHEALLGEAAMVAAVGGALNNLGGGWIRCEANQLLGKDNCHNGPRRAEKIIRDLALIGIAFDFKAFVEAAEIVAKGIGATVAAFEQPFIGNLEPLP